MPPFARTRMLFYFSTMKNILLLLCLAIVQSSFAQSNIDATVAIKELKNGAIVVNLIHPTKKIEALLASGRKEESIALQESVMQDHKDLINAFTQNYSFSKLLFVYSTDMGKLADGDASVLFSASGNAQSSLPETIYFVELAKTEEQSLNGLVVKDKNRDPLAKPFPYFVSQYAFLRIKKRTYNDMTEELNRRLTDFYRHINN